MFFLIIRLRDVVPPKLDAVLNFAKIQRKTFEFYAGCAVRWGDESLLPRFNPRRATMNYHNTFWNFVLEVSFAPTNIRKFGKLVVFLEIGCNRSRNTCDRKFMATAPGVWQTCASAKTFWNMVGGLKGAIKCEKFTCRPKARRIQRLQSSVDGNHLIDGHLTAQSFSAWWGFPVTMVWVLKNSRWLNRALLNFHPHAVIFCLLSQECTHRNGWLAYQGVGNGRPPTVRQRYLQWCMNMHSLK